MFIKDFYAISAQETTNGLFEHGNVHWHDAETVLAKEPDYLSFIPAGLLRRMGKAVRMGIGAGLPLVKKHTNLSGIIIGSANGGLEDCIKFLNQIVDYDEGVLTPTNFVQSTPNALAGQLALMSENQGYNMTHTHNALAFETALIDAELFLKTKSSTASLLVGAVEEISDYNYNIEKAQGLYKGGSVQLKQLIESGTPGTICGEGATMFVLSNESTDALAEVVACACYANLEEKDMEEAVESFKQQYLPEGETIDMLLSGFNGDERLRDSYLHVEQLVSPNETATFKQFIGDYKTASAFGVYTALLLFKNQFPTRKGMDAPKNVLTYTRGHRNTHGFILLKSLS